MRKTQHPGHVAAALEGDQPLHESAEGTPVAPESSTDSLHAAALLFSAITVKGTNVLVGTKNKVQREVPCITMKLRCVHAIVLCSIEVCI